MANPEKESLEKVKSAMLRLNGLFEEKIDAFRQQGKEGKEILELVKGAAAMRDAAGIYLAWANHYIERLEKSEVGTLTEEAEEGLDV